MDDQIRTVVTQITGDMSLTEDMNDAEASILIEWGADMARQMVLMVGDMSPEGATIYIDENLPKLRRVMRRINGIVGNLPYEEADEVTSRLPKLFEAAGDVPVLTGFHVPDDMIVLARSLTEQSQREALKTLLHYLTPTYSTDTNHEA